MHAAFCDVCKCDPIVGTRWKCGNCANYDVCNACKLTLQHDNTHIFLELRRPLDVESSNAVALLGSTVMKTDIFDYVYSWAGLWHVLSIAQFCGYVSNITHVVDDNMINHVISASNSCCTFSVSVSHRIWNAYPMLHGSKFVRPHMSSEDMIGTAICNMKWKHPFKVSETADRSFGAMTVPMMNRKFTKGEATVYESNGIFMVELPLIESDFYIRFVQIPSMHAVSSTAEFTQCTWTDVIIRIPRFVFTATSVQLKPYLMNAGLMQMLFDDYSLTQKIVVSIDEHGAQCIAKTQFYAFGGSVPKIITFDRPFAFAVYYRQASLFSGVVDEGTFVPKPLSLPFATKK